MTAKEFDNFANWLFCGSRLRAIAATWLLICAFVSALCYPCIVVMGANDIAAEECNVVDRWGDIHNRPNGYRPPDAHGVCNANGDLIVEADWTGVGLDFAKWTMIVGLIGFAVPLSNTALLGTRNYSRTARLRWTQSATKRALDERTRRMTAEALSEQAERETERLTRELERMGAYNV